MKEVQMGTVKLKATKLLSLIEAGEWVRNERWVDGNLYVGLTPQGNLRFSYYDVATDTHSIVNDGDNSYDRYIREDVLVYIYTDRPWTILKKEEKQHEIKSVSLQGRQ